MSEYWHPPCIEMMYSDLSWPKVDSKLIDGELNWQSVDSVFRSFIAENIYKELAFNTLHYKRLQCITFRLRVNFITK